MRRESTGEAEVECFYENLQDLLELTPKKFVLFSIRLYFHHRSHTQLGIVFTLAQSLIVSGIICPFFSSSILGTYWPGKFIFQCHIFLPFYAVHGVLKGGILKQLAFPFSSGSCFVRTLHYDPSILGGPTWHG